MPKEWFEIIAHRRDGGQPEYLYRGSDYSTVSDTMPNQGDASRTFERVECYANGQRIENNTLVDRDEPQSNPLLVLFLFIIGGLILYFILFH